MTNDDFIRALEESFKAFLDSGCSSRSTQKLIPLHGAIAWDMRERFDPDYTIMSKGYGDDREGKIFGRYMPKDVDITILHAGTPVGGIGVKFVMSNYAQNSNNYFENMLGETANIRTAHCPYFQLFALMDRIPYYKKGGVISRWEEPTAHQFEKYCYLDGDDPGTYYHTPNKMLVYLVHLEEINGIGTRNDYQAKYAQLVGERPSGFFSLRTLEGFSPHQGVIINDYESFAEKVYHTIMAR